MRCQWRAAGAKHQWTLSRCPRNGRICVICCCGHAAPTEQPPAIALALTTVCAHLSSSEGLLARRRSRWILVTRPATPASSRSQRTATRDSVNLPPVPHRESVAIHRVAQTPLGCVLGAEFEEEYRRVSATQATCLDVSGLRPGNECVPVEMTNPAMFVTMKRTMDANVLRAKTD